MTRRGAGLLFVVVAGVLVAVVVGWFAVATFRGPEQMIAGRPTTVANDPFRVDQPKELKAIPDPCQLLNPQQRDQLAALPAGTYEPTPWGQQACLWRNKQLTVSVAPNTVQGYGLKYTAKVVADGEPTAQVAGYPAVREGVSSGACGIVVGTSDTEIVLVSFQLGPDGRGNPDFSDPCAMSDRIAEMVLSNLPSR
ncbi:DUF3558 domain-containing protein [Saccharopolyspora sp. NPDC002686]|uniref:DUF3558 domain-containing protein n=1 Tax=Saccharopolyspora sp. NPDC002686 TaxID=3154541 RepID=UPI003317E915